MTLERDRLHAAIVSWDGMHAQAAAIAGALSGVVGKISVVYSNADATPETGAGDWIEVPQSAFFGHKFRVLLDRVAADETMLLIQADAGCDDWAGLARRCLALLGPGGASGGDGPAVWSPSIGNTPFPNNLVATGRSPGPGLIEVWQCDAIVLAMVPVVLDRLRALDFEMNNLGWGIDWASILEARGKGLAVVRDLGCTVRHPPSRGYASDVAVQQMWAFLSQLDAQDRATYHDIEHRIRLRRAERADGVHLMASHLAERRAAGAADAVDLDALNAAFAAVRLERGRLTVIPLRPGQPVDLEIGAAGRYPMAPLEGPPDFRLLTLDPPALDGLGIERAAGGDWGCPGQATLCLTFARGMAEARLPLTPVLDLPRDQGALRLSMGIAVHRADADLLVEWWDAEDRDRGGTQFVKFDEGFSGSRARGDYQAVRLVIPDTGGDRQIRISLCFWSGRGEPSLPSVMFLTHPVLEPARGSEPETGPLTVPLMTRGLLPGNVGGGNAGAENEGAGNGGIGRPLGIELGVVSGPVALHLGTRRFPLLGGGGGHGAREVVPETPAPENPVSLAPCKGGLAARSDAPCRVVLALNGRLTRALWTGPEETPLNLAPGFLATPGARVELRDAGGTRVLARHVVAAGI